MDAIFNPVIKDDLSKNEIELLQKKKHEYKLIGSQRKVAGHTLFSFNLITKEIKIAKLEKCDTIHFFTLLPLVNDKIKIEKNCVYRQALNKKNFKKVLFREGFAMT